jgi:hypothetical protein
MTIPPRTLLLVLCWFSIGLLGDGGAVRADEPPKLTGSWTWTWKDPQGVEHRHVMEIEGVGPKLAARERFDDLPPVAVSNLKLGGNNIKFTVVRGEKRADYRGVAADSDTMNGKVSITQEGQTTEFLWKATRVKAAE